MKVIGLTGGIGCGKSKVAEILKEEYNATILLTDDIAKAQYNKGCEGYIKLCELFDCNMDTLVRGDAEAEEKEEIKIDLGDLEEDEEEIDVDENDEDDEEEREHIKKRRKRSRAAERVNEVICSVVMTIASFSYVLYGLLAGVWSPTWVIFIVGAGICAISSIITEAIGK